MNSTKKYKNNFHNIADDLRLKNSFKQAAKNYLNAILIDRNNAESYFGLGICYKNLEDYPKAIEYLDKSSELKDDDYRVFFELGICHQLEGNFCGAIKNFIRAIQINPDNPEAILQLGISHELCEEDELALMIYKKIIENTPSFVKAYEHYSSLQMKLENYKEASKILHRLIKINSDSYSAYAGIGVCFEKLGKISNASRYYRKYLSLMPFSKDAQTIRLRLEKIRTAPKNNKFAIV